MKTAIPLLICLMLLGCDSSKPADPAKKESSKPPKKSGGDQPPAQEKKSNPLVGRWVIKKVGTQDWSPTVSKEAVIEFRGDGAIPNTGSIIVTDRNATGKGDYELGKEDFFFEVKFRHKDGSPAGGYSGLFQITKMTDREIVGDLFTLERMK